MAPTTNLAEQPVMDLLPDMAPDPQTQQTTPGEAVAVARGRRRFLSWVLALTVLGVGSLGVLASIPYWPLGQTDSAGNTSSVKSRDNLDVFGFGLVDFEHGTMSLAPLQVGRVAEVLVKENQRVPARAVLVRLEDGQAKSRVAAAQAAVETAEVLVAEAAKGQERLRSRITQIESAVEIANLRISAARELLTRKKRLASQDLLPQEEASIAEDDVKQLEAAARAEQARLAELRTHDPESEQRRARAELATARANLEQAQQALDDCQLKAPCAGIVLRRFANVGDVIGEQVKKAAVLFGPDGPRVIRVEIDQEFARGLEEDQVAEAQDDIRPDRVWTGWVQFVSPWFLPKRENLDEMFQSHDTRTLECRIALNPDQPPLRFGQRMRVTIKRGEKVQR